MAFSISANGATQTIYISQDGDGLKYNINDGANQLITSYPIGITNTNGTPSSNILKVIFTTSLTVDDNSLYFKPITDGIQFGSTSLNAQGARTSISVAVDNYDGFIYNGEAFINAKSYIYVYNLVVDGSGYSTQVGAGWVGQKYFGKGGTNNFILNCSSSGDINGGGILGDYAENVTLIGCSSTGEIGTESGGIVGKEVVSVVIQGCWSTGVMSGDSAGGMAGSNTRSATITKCYSEGILSGNNTGGITGANTGINLVSISNCYSKGAIQGANAGGICGSLATTGDTLTVVITNCYSTGNLDNTIFKINGGISGPLLAILTGTINLTITNCYVVGTLVESNGYIVGNRSTINGTNASPEQFLLTNNYSEAGSAGGSAGTWSDAHARTVLTGSPNASPDVGNVWTSAVSDTAFELTNFGTTPYQTQTISENALVQTYSQTVEKGDSSIEALEADASGNAFAILEKTGGDTDSYATITINSQTGMISTTSETVPGTYTLYIRSTGSYNITRFILTVTETIPMSDSSACCSATINERGLDYAQILDYKIGNRLILEHQQNPNQKFDGYSQYVKYKMALNSQK